MRMGMPHEEAKVTTAIEIDEDLIYEVARQLAEDEWHEQCYAAELRDPRYIHAGHPTYGEDFDLLFKQRLERFEEKATAILAAEMAA